MSNPKQERISEVTLLALPTDFPNVRHLVLRIFRIAPRLC